MKNLLAFTFCLVVSLPGFGIATNLWTGAVDDFDWTNGGNFRYGLPAAGDVVQISNATVRLDADTAAGAASIAKINTLEKLWPVDENAVLEVTVSGEASIDVPFTAYPAKNDFRLGELRKKGAGILNLTSKSVIYGSTVADYHAHLHVIEGSLKMAKDTTSCATLGKVTIEEGACFFPNACSPGVTPDTWSNCALQWKEAWGKGTITNDYPTATTVYYIRPYGSTYCEFAGDISPQFRFMTVSGNWALTGTNSLTANQIPVIMGNSGRGPDAGLGVLSVMKIGMRGQRSSIGPHNYMVNFRGNGGCLRYIGPGETSDKYVTWQGIGNNAACWNFIDGGPHGDLVLSGMFRGYQNTARTMVQTMERIMLTGSNAAPCIVTGNVSTNSCPTDANVSHPFFGKQGSGTWRFADSADTNRVTRTFGTPFVVEGGTLAYDSLREAGEFCALGMGDMLLEPFTGIQADGTPVDWFFALGRTNANHAVPTLAFTGLGKWNHGVCVSTRKVLLKGSGRIANNSSKRFRLAGVSSAAGGDEAVKSLYLGGSNTTGDEILDISDGAGKTGIVKDGEGTWSLGGDLTFTGPVDVRAGVLKINAVSSRYTWFKFVIKELLGNSPNFIPNTRGTASEFILGHLGVYDSEGNDLVAGKVTTDLDATVTFSSVTDWTALEPGYCATGYSDGFSLPSGSASAYATNQRECNNLFLTSEGNYGRAVRMRGKNGNGAINLADTSSWHSVVFRLPDSVTADVASWDAWQAKGYNQSDSNRAVTAYAFLASPDGVHWDTITDEIVTKDTMRANSKHWLHNAVTVFNATKHTTGFPMNGARATAFTIAPLSVTVAPGATLLAEGPNAVTIKALTLSGAGGGTIDGFSFAAEGTLDVTGLPNGTSAVTVPVTFANATDLGNMSRWAFCLDGAATAKMRFDVSANGITVRPIGFTLVIQ